MRPVFPTGRIFAAATLLRPVLNEDSGYIKAWLNNPEVMRFWGGLSETVSDEQSRTWVAGYVSAGNQKACLVIEAGGVPVGFILLSCETGDANYRHKVEVDICIGDPSRWNSGLGTDALTALLRWIFTSTDVVRVYLQPRSVNARAVHVYEKVGFKKEGTVRNGEMIDGVLYDCVMMGALRDEWLAEFGR